MRQVRGRGTDAAANRNVMVIDRCSFESNDRIVGRFQLWIVGLFVVQVINSTVGVEPDSFQEIVTWKTLFAYDGEASVCQREPRNATDAGAANLSFPRIGISNGSVG
jgi:hypothetical protein